MNILVGPNNNGKSTVVGAFRVLSQALRVARSRNADIVWDGDRQRPGWTLQADNMPISSENIHTDYDEVDTNVEFRLSNGSTLRDVAPNFYPA